MEAKASNDWQLDFMHPLEKGRLVELCFLVSE